MRIRITTNSGKKIMGEVKDPTMAGFMARLKGPDAWIELDSDETRYLNRDVIVMIEAANPPPPE